MRSTKATHLSICLPLIAMFVMALMAAPDYSYAQRTRSSRSTEQSESSSSRSTPSQPSRSESSVQSRGSSSDRSSSARSQPSRNESSVQQRNQSSSQSSSRSQPSRNESSTEQRTESRSESSTTRSQPSRNESSTQQRTESRSESSTTRSQPSRNESSTQQRTESRSESSTTRSQPSRSEGSTQQRTESRSEGTTTTRSPAPATNETRVRTDNRSTSARTTQPTTAGTQRRDFSDIGRIWQERQERRTPPTTTTRSSSNVHLHINYVFPGRYTHYMYSYRHGYVYPSLYCYYYGLFPPYIPSYRVVYVRRNVGITYTYIDLPISVIRRDYDYYYSSDYRHRTLSNALRNIERAWDRGDIELLMRHVRRGSRVDVLFEGDYAYSVDRSDYHEMTLDAMENISTLGFEFYRIRQRSSVEVVAYGKHTYFDDFYRDSESRKTVYVSYRLRRTGNDWYITEVGSSPYRF